MSTHSRTLDDAYNKKAGLESKPRKLKKPGS